MSEPKSIDVEPEQTPGWVEVVQTNQTVALREPMGLFGAVGPVEIIKKATEVATALKTVIVAQGLVSEIQGREYPRVEAWTLLGTMLGVFPVLTWSRPVEFGWEARVEAKMKDGTIVGAAEAECLSSENNWSARDDYAIRSMAQTRATAKALRMPLGFVMTLAGYEATPAEEMPPAGAEAPQPRSTPPQSQAKRPEPAHTPTGPSREATEVTKAWMINHLEPCRQEATRYAIDVGWILSTEKLEDIPLNKVPTTKAELVSLIASITHFGITGKVVQLVPRTVGDKVSDPPKSHQQTNLLDWWWDFPVPVPRKGMKRDAYLKAPDTIRSLFDARHGNNEEAATARRRLFGFVHNFEAKTWKSRQGKTMMPSDTDKKFREALDLFWAWFEVNHPGEKL